MGLFSEKKPSLASEIFLPSEVLRPSAQDTILSELFGIVPAQLVWSVWIVGSSIGKRFEATTDIDVQVQITDKEKLDYYKTEFKVHNRSGKGSYIGKHPIYYFAVPIIIATDTSNLTGAYDVLNNKWVKRSMENPPGFDQQVAQSQPYLGLLKREVGRQIDQAEANPTLREKQDVADVYGKLEKSRKITYQYGTGTPRFSSANVAYKGIEYEHGDVPSKIHRLVRRIIRGE